MGTVLETQNSPEIQTADSRFFNGRADEQLPLVDRSALDVLRGSMVARASAIAEGKRAGSPLVEYDVDAFYEERKDFEEIVTASNGVLRLTLAEKLTKNSVVYNALHKDYALPSEDDRRVFAVPSSQITASRLVPEQDGLGFTAPPALDLRIRTSSERGPRIFAPDWTKGPDAPRVIEQPSPGRWYHFPLEDIQVHLLETTT